MDYNSFSAIYDLTCPGVEGDLAFFTKKSIEVTGKILEVGCGTGRIYLELLKLNCNIKGIDSSTEMLAILESKAKQMSLVPNVKVCSITDYTEESQFELIILPYRTFMHLYTKEDQVSALRNLKRALTPTGEIVIDLFNPDMLRIKKGSNYILLEHAPDHLVWLWEEFNEREQIVHNTFRLEKKDKHDVITSAVVKQFKARWFFADEFRNLVETEGLVVKDIFSDYSGKSFTGEEDKMIWVLK